ncbi:DUF4334 domain-containing protein [Actinomadura logoneensis]|uniref:DUF4334 domain-containing protein n=1 Tax=Actinomadura logoneensis TaxID=2293572 RepID=A0A372JUB6_9ACTN|nr:DUF4334 domain-containing protein [Actinomadura logoneensis]RFU43396.1 DUF4334 domain-containing protein [Actinomadura logoneensis]
MSTEDRALALVLGHDLPRPGELAALFRELPPVAPARLTGLWRGGVFDPEDRMARLLARLRWYGKRFTDPEDVDPLVCRTDDGGLYTYDGMGSARLREVVYEGVPSAAMVYDGRPIIDHFRLVADDVLMGAMDAKGEASVLYFHLTREPEEP